MNNLTDRLANDLKEAMKAKDQARLRGIRAVKAAVLLMKTDGSGADISPEREIAMLQKLIKQRRESADIYHNQNRPELAAVEEEEIAVIESYLPAQLSAEEVETVVRTVIADLGATSVKDMGKVMAAASKALAGQADNKVISEIVKKLLA